ncbi:MAG TPA: hypothetical protein VF576_01570 [Rubricoccaceae bacterium]
MRRLALLTLLVATATVHAQTGATRERYAEVRVSAPEGAGRVGALLAAAGVGLDHAVPEKAADGAPALRVVLSETDVAAARAAGLRVDVLTDDLEARTAARASAGGCPAAPAPITGSMGCYPTYAETSVILDQMRAEFPALVSVRTSIGTTAGGRAVWAVEVGDNPRA